MQEQREESVVEFVTGYFKSFADAATKDYNTFTMVIFAVFASIAFGLIRGMAYATGLYAVLHMVAGALSSVSGSIAHVGNCIRDHS